ncbi:hypothetical protein BJX99DRAFT_261709 [Aspergillus californicus]
MSTLKVITLLAALILPPLTQAVKLHDTYSSCSNNSDITAVYIEPCFREPCTVRDGAPIRITVEGTSDLFGDVDEVTVDYDIEDEGFLYHIIEGQPSCGAFISCPIPPHQDFRYRQDIAFPAWVWEGKRRTQLRISSGYKQLACVNIHLVVQDHD